MGKGKPHFLKNPKRGFKPLSHREKARQEPSDEDEEMTGTQASYLKTLSDEANEDFDPNLSRAEATERIEELQRETGRGPRVHH